MSPRELPVAHVTERCDSCRKLHELCTCEDGPPEVPWVELRPTEDELRAAEALERTQEAVLCALGVPEHLLEAP